MTASLAPAFDRAPSPWSPGPGYTELLTPGAWSRQLGADEHEVVIVTTTHAGGGGPALISGVLSTTLVSLADYWLDNPTELRLLVETGLLQRHAVSPEHPTLATTVAPEAAVTPSL
ncbi:hypothetical protein DL991_41230 [Amycolatopsis sp. WAC 01375]|uniref:hypothetical protein n=1 Tax=Amycolatopsis sp. WAC 01375 TaxID=2203194 RepID=UPI000F79BB28|nr:hypothetical protein [Amycolatopsis sp. WAC 01375]RSM68695.1 hypothetical protein DL991_41230 [Amycolatopsis sp. WAC 01375]